jgi:hypothetical protein
VTIDYLGTLGATEPKPVNGKHKPEAPPAHTKRLGAFNLTRMNLVEPVAVEWLWKNWIARGKFHLAFGPPGVGKSFVVGADLTARLTNGTTWPDGSPGAEPTSVLQLCPEDGLADVLQPRLVQHGADLKRVVVVQSRIVGDYADSVERQVDFGRDADELDVLLEAHPEIGCIVADPITEHLGGIDGNSNIEVRQKLMPIVKLAERRRIAFIAVSHINKGGAGPALFRAAGSVAFGAVARIAWIFVKDPDTEGRTLVLPTKNNLGPMPKGLAFSIVDGRVEWEADAVNVSADEAVEPRQPGKRPEQLGKAVAWLREQLAGGCKESRQIEKDATAAGITKATLWRAREELKVQASKIRGSKAGGCWISLPAAEDPQDSLRELDECVERDEDVV